MNNINCDLYHHRNSIGMLNFSLTIDNHTSGFMDSHFYCCQCGHWTQLPKLCFRLSSQSRLLARGFHRFPTNMSLSTTGREEFYMYHSLWIFVKSQVRVKVASLQIQFSYRQENLDIFERKSKSYLQKRKPHEVQNIHFNPIASLSMNYVKVF